VLTDGGNQGEDGMSTARFWHFWVGVALLIVYLLAKSQHLEGRILMHPLALALLLPVTYLGTTLPDWDIWLLGIGAHRNPIFHSALPYFLVALGWRLVGGDAWLRSPLAVRLATAAQVGFVLGLCSHLLLDVVQYGDVRWITGNTWGKLWLAIHGAVLLLIAWFPHCARHQAFSVRSTR
jgi:hypothetical protein